MTAVKANDAAGNRTSEEIDNDSVTSGYNDNNQLTGQSGGGSMVFAGTLNKPGTVKVSGNAAVMSNGQTNFRGIASVTQNATNNVPIVATNLNGYATTNTFHVVVPATTSSSYTYDNAGNLLTDGTRTFKYDAKGEMVGIIYASTHTDFTYNGLGQRVAIVERAGTTLGTGTISSTKQYVVGEERNASNDVTKRYFTQGEQRVSGSTVTSYFYTRDHLGSIREVVDSSGTTQAEYAYDPYGRRTQVSGSFVCDFGFTGHYWHSPSSLYLSPTRAYDPNLGRWISRDPLAESAGLNMYEYCGDNPICNVDPTGLDDNLFDAQLTFDMSGSGGGSGGCMDDNPVRDPGLEAAADGDEWASENPYIAGPFGENVLDNPLEMMLINMFPGALADQIHQAGQGNPNGLILSILLMSMGDADASIGEQIAGGHAFAKHAAEFGFTSPEQMAQHIDNIIANPTAQKSLSNGRAAFWDAQSGTVVITNPNVIDGGTAFIPKNGENYYLNLH